MEKNHVIALKRAIEISGGSQAKLAAKLREFGRTKASQQLVSYWLNNEVFIDPDWWAAIEFATGDLVTRSDLRPDVFSREHAA